MAQPGLGAASIAKVGVSLGEGDPLWALWNDLSVQYELSSRVHAFASLATSHEPLPSGYDRYPEQRTELRFSLEYQLPQLPFTLQSS